MFIHIILEVFTSIVQEMVLWVWESIRGERPPSVPARLTAKQRWEIVRKETEARRRLGRWGPAVHQSLLLPQRSIPCPFCGARPLAVTWRLLADPAPQRTAIYDVRCTSCCEAQHFLLPLPAGAPDNYPQGQWLGFGTEVKR